MKKFCFLLLLFAASQVYGQKKGKVDPKDLQIDSLTKAKTALTIQLDSISKELEKYMGVYTAVKTKVLKYDFDPAKTSVLIDSIRASRDSATSGLSSTTSSLKDSLNLQKQENAQLKVALDSLKSGDKIKEKTVADLKQLKELLDAKIITQQEFDVKKKSLLEKWN